MNKLKESIIDLLSNLEATTKITLSFLLKKRTNTYKFSKNYLKNKVKINLLKKECANERKK